MFKYETCQNETNFTSSLETKMLFNFIYLLIC